MVDVVAAVITYLKADTRTAAKVGTRVYRAEITQTFEQMPAIMVMKVDDLRGNHTSTGRYSTTRIQASCYAKTDAEADELSEIVGDALDTLVNTRIGSSTGYVYIISCFDAGVVPDNSPKSQMFVYHRDFRITHQVRI